MEKELSLTIVHSSPFKKISVHIEKILFDKDNMQIMPTTIKGRHYGMVPEGLSFFGSLYKEGAKTTSETSVYHFKRQTARRNISSFPKHCPQLRM